MDVVDTMWDTFNIPHFPSSLLAETLVAAHLGVPAAGLANTRLSGSGPATNPRAHSGVDAGGVRGNCAARVPGIILSAKDRAGDCDDSRKSPYNPAEDEPGGHSRRDSDVPL